MSQLWQLSVAELSKLVRSRAVSPIEISESCIRRYEQLNGTLNAIVACNPESTIEQARRSESRMLQNELLSPLDGIPITIKDNIFAKGFRATWGSLLYESFEPDIDDYCVERLRNAGAVIFGKTNTPEFALSAHTNNLIFGKTKNPWDLTLTPGGSSGGAVSSLASGMAPLAVATDAGGSIRRPCSYTGLVGLRTSTDRIQRRPGFKALVHDFQVIAPAARTVDDLYLLLNEISAHDVRKDMASLRDECLIPANEKLRISVISGIKGYPIDPEIAGVIDQTGQRFAELGHEVTCGQAPYDPDFISDIWNTLSSANLYSLLSSFNKEEAKKVTPAMSALAEIGQGISENAYESAIKAVLDFRSQISKVFNSCDVLLTPASAAMPWCVELPYPGSISDQVVGPRAAAIFATFVNAARLPAISVPAGFSSAGIPIGMQLIGPNWSDFRLLALAKQYEQAFSTKFQWPRIAVEN